MLHFPHVLNLAKSSPIADSLFVVLELLATLEAIMERRLVRLAGVGSLLKSSASTASSPPLLMSLYPTIIFKLHGNDHQKNRAKNVFLIKKGIVRTCWRNRGDQRIPSFCFCCVLAFVLFFLFLLFLYLVVLLVYLSIFCFVALMYISRISKIFVDDCLLISSMSTSRFQQK